MPIVTCSCGAKLKLSDNLKNRGKTIRCPKCGLLSEIIVPDSKETKEALQNIERLDELERIEAELHKKRLYDVTEVPYQSKRRVPNPSRHIVSPAGGIIISLGILSIFGGFGCLLHPEIENEYKYIILPSSVISGIFMCGFGSMVNLLTKIEYHLRTR